MSPLAVGGTMPCILQPLVVTRLLTGRSLTGRLKEEIAVPVEPSDAKLVNVVSNSDSPQGGDAGYATDAPGKMGSNVQEVLIHINNRGRDRGVDSRP